MFGRKKETQAIPATVPTSIARARLAIVINRVAEAQSRFTNTDAPRLRLSALLAETQASLAAAQAAVNGVKGAEIQDIKTWGACGDDSSPTPRTTELREAEKDVTDADDRVAYVEAALEEAKQRSAIAQEHLDATMNDFGEATYDVLIESVDESALQYLKALEQAANLASEIEGAHELIRARFRDLPPEGWSGSLAALVTSQLSRPDHKPNLDAAKPPVQRRVDRD